MRRVVFLASLFALFAAVPTMAHALDEVILSDGTVHRAEVLEVNEDGIRVRFSPKSGGTVAMRLPASRLDPHYFYHLWDERLGDDAKGRLKLALWAVENGLFSRAKLQVERAAEIDPQLVKDIQEGKLPEIREGIATRVLESAVTDMEEGRFENAEKKLEALLTRMPDTEAGTRAIEVYKELETRIADDEEKQEAKRLERLAEEERKRDEALRKRVEPIQKDLTKAKEYLQQGLTEDAERQALQLLARAVSKGEDGLKGLEKLEAEVGDDAELKAKIQDVRKRTIAGMVKAYIHRADIYTWRGSTANARKEIAEARKLDPDNSDVAAAEQRADDQDERAAYDLDWRRDRVREGTRFRARTAAPGVRGGGGGGGRR